MTRLLPEKPEVHEQRIAKQQSVKEIQADQLARLILQLEQLEDKKKNFNAEYKMEKEKLLTQVKTTSEIIRNYAPQFEDVDTETGEIK